MRGGANRGCSAEIRLGAPVRFSIHAGGDGRRTAGEYAGLVGVVSTISGRASSCPLRVLGAAGCGGAYHPPQGVHARRKRPTTDARGLPLQSMRLGGGRGRTTRASASTLGETVPPPMPGGYGFSQ